MDWDEPKAKSGRAISVGDTLDTLSIGELEERVLALDREIARVKAEIQAKKARQNAAANFFKT